MANWSGIILTDRGRALQAKVETGVSLNITKFKLGDGIASGALESLLDLVHPLQTVGIGSVKALGGMCEITGVLTNSSVTTGYYLRELGIYAMDPDLGEILYAITTDSAPDYLPPGGGNVVISEEFSINIAISNATNVTAILNPQGLVTTTIMQSAISNHNNDENAHPGLKTLVLNSGINLWTAKKSYSIGDIAYSKNLPSWAFAECTTAGTTGTSEPLWSSATVGQTFTDGSCTWTIRDIKMLTKLNISDYNLDTEMTIIYPNGGNETNPANVSNNTRYEDNVPAGFNNYNLLCVAEVLANGKWGETGWGTYDGAGALQAGYGVRSFLFDGKIITQVGTNSVIFGPSAYVGNPFGATLSLGTAPCRVKLFKIAKIGG